MLPSCWIWQREDLWLQSAGQWPVARLAESDDSSQTNFVNPVYYILRTQAILFMEKDVGSICYVLSIRHTEYQLVCGEHTGIDYTIFNISITLIFPLLFLTHLLFLIYFYQKCLFVYSVLPFTFCWILGFTTNISDTLILLDSWVKFLVESFQEKFLDGASFPFQMSERFFYYGTDQRRPLVSGSIFYWGSGGSCSSVQPSFLDLFKAFDIVAGSIFPETSPFDLSWCYK